MWKFTKQMDILEFLWHCTNLLVVTVPHCGRLRLQEERLVCRDCAQGDNGAEHVQAVLLEVGLQDYV